MEEEIPDEEEGTGEGCNIKEKEEARNDLIYGMTDSPPLHITIICGLQVRSSVIYLSITKTRLYNFDPLKPHFYIVKLGFTRVYTMFLISAQKHKLWVLVRTASPRRF